VITWLGVVVAVFALTHILPGNPAQVRLGTFATPEALAALEKEMGLDRPVSTQFVVYFTNLLRGDMGVSYKTSQPVAKDILQRLPASLELAAFSILIATALGLPLGILAAVNKDSPLDQAVRGLVVFGASTPLFWLGLMMIFVFFFTLQWTAPPLGRFDPVLPAPERLTGFFTLDSLLRGDLGAFRLSLSHLVLPGATLAIIIIAPIIKIVRASMLQVLGADFIRTARAIGMRPLQIVTQDALKNALVPIVTMIGIVIGYLLGGNVIVERIFAWPGIGQYLFEAILANDFEAIQGTVLTVAVMYVLLNLLVDLLYAVLDPRIRLG
jgi:peptide/nickel transport system permease protein